MSGEHDPWVAHRRRADVLRTRYGFAAEALTLYRELAGLWAGAWQKARADRPTDLAGWAAERVLPDAADVTLHYGPEILAKATQDLLAAGGMGQAMADWLAGGDLPPVERYLARACLTAPIAAVGWTGTPSGRHCPHCGGLPQLSVRAAGADPLVSEPRRLVCERCAQSWNYSRSACPFCGETEGAKRTMYAEDGGTLFPHLSVEACESCRHYLIDVNLGRDREAVPDVDELAALPLGLYAADLGLTKITPNLLGL
jgi:hypothetical protein